MQNSLYAAREARAASEKQLAELQTAIAAESVSFSVLPPPFFFFSLLLTHAGSTRYGIGSTCHDQKDAN